MHFRLAATDFVMQNLWATEGRPYKCFLVKCQKI